jgi:hypothetical protein
MGHFNSLPKDVLWLVLRQTFLSERDDLTRANGRYKFLWSLYELENFDFSFSDTFYERTLCKLALINRVTLKVVRSKVKRQSRNKWQFVKGSLNIKH